MKRLLLAVALMCIPAPALAQNTVQLTPVPRQQFNDSSGRPLAGGFFYSYVAGSSTPQATYTDSTGTTQNTNPVQLDSGGFATIWLLQAPYRICVANSSNVQQWCVDQVTTGANLLILTNLWTNPQTWQTFGTFSAGLSVAGGLTTDTLATSGGIGVGGAPASLSGGINGNAGWALAVANTALVTFTSGNVAVNGAISIAGPILSNFNSGPPFVVASSTQVANLNASLLEGQTFESPNPIGSTAANSGVFTSMTVQNLIGGTCVQAGTNGLLESVPGICLNPSIVGLTTKLLAANVDLPANTLITVDAQTVNMPASGCPCRVIISYSYFWETVAGSGADTINMYRH